MIVNFLIKEYVCLNEALPLLREGFFMGESAGREVPRWRVC